VFCAPIASLANAEAGEKVKDASTSTLLPW